MALSNEGRNRQQLKLRQFVAYPERVYGPIAFFHLEQSDLGVSLYFGSNHFVNKFRSPLI